MPNTTTFASAVIGDTHVSIRQLDILIMAGYRLSFDIRTTMMITTMTMMMTSVAD